MFSAYAMALEYGGFTNFPAGINTAAEREGFAGPFQEGATTAQADTQAKARYGVTLDNLDTDLRSALKRPNYAYVVTGNYKNLSANSNLAKDVYGWNNYDTSNPLPSVDHAVTVITNPDGTLSWLDPTAAQGSSGVNVTIDDVMKFNGGNVSDYPVKQIKEKAFSGGGTDDEYVNVQELDPYVGKTFAELNAQPGVIGQTFQSFMGSLGKSPSDTFTAEDAAYIRGLGKNGSDWISVIVPSNPLDALGKMVTIMGSLTDPANWIHISAVLAGGLLIIFAGYIIAKDLGAVDAVQPPQEAKQAATIVMMKGA